MNNSLQQLSNPTSTGGLGVHFENRVQASFAVLMLTGGYAPCLPTWPISKIKLQGKYQNFNTDDVIVYAKHQGTKRQAKLLGQIKYDISITKLNKVFGQVIKAAWHDFKNVEVFNEGTDFIALITGPLSGTDTDHVRDLLRQAEHSGDEEDFINRIERSHFTSQIQREKLDAFRVQLKAANNDVDLTNRELWRFLRSFRLLIYDLDIKGVTLSLLHTLIGQYTQDRAEELLALIEKEISFKSENAGVITPESFPENIYLTFSEPTKKTIPEELITPQSMEIVNTDWNHHEYASRLAIANLLGSWNEKNDSDIEIIAQLAREEYSDWISKIREIIHLPDSPVTFKNGIWKVTSREELWKKLGPRLFDSNLETLEQCIVLVLTERDPQFDLKPDDRPAANIYGKILKYSNAMRKGLCDSLALLNVHSEALTNCSMGMAATIAKLVVSKMFENADWERWASLNDLLPTIAEADPDEFINAIENTLYQSPCPFDELFAQEDSGITGRNYLAGLLWALETLAWNEQLLVRVTVILGELASRDPGGNWANRPSNSIVTIFLPWLPQTTASISKRKVSVKTLLKEYPDVGWRLLINLLPNQRQTSSGSHKPVWRKMNLENENVSVSRQDYWDQIENYSEMAVEQAMADFSRLTELIRQLDNLPLPSFEKVLNHLSSEFVLLRPENERISLWTELIVFASNHKRHSDAEWALKPELVDKIEWTANALSPTNPILVHRLIFSSEQEFEVYDEAGDWDQQRKQVEERRQEAVKEILDYGGMDALLQFVTTVESPQFVGDSLGILKESEADSVILPNLLNNENKKLAQFASAFVWGRYRSEGWVWADNVNMNGWSPAQTGRFFSCLPFIEETWNRVHDLVGEFESEYWAIVNVNPYQTDSGLERAIDKLIEYGRPNSAIDCVYKILHDKKPIDNDRAIQALLAAVSTSEPSYTTNRYPVVQIIKALQQNPDTNRDGLLNVEWAYLPILGRYDKASPKLLEHRLATDPGFFCEVIRLIYRSKKALKTDEEPTEQQKSIAHNAYRLLDEWKTPPGLQPDGEYLGNEFVSWLEKVKEICTETGHLQVALTHVGNILYYAPADPDGLWIHRVVAEELNYPDAEKMRNGYRLEVYNSRGAHWVDPTAAPERELAEKFRGKAEDVENAGYHRFAASLRTLAQSYDYDAGRIIAEHEQEMNG